MTPARRRIAWIGLILVAYGWRVSGLDRQSLWRDEVDAIYFAVRSLAQTTSMFVQAAQNGPLYFLALRPWFHWMGTSEFVLRYPSVMAGTLSVPLLYQVGRQLLPPRAVGPISAAMAGAIFFAFNPYQVWYGQEGKMYATITCLALLATWLWLQGISRGRWWHWLGYLATVTVAMYMHLLMVLIVPLHLTWYFLAWPASRRHWRGYGLALTGLTVPYVPMVWWQWSFLTSAQKQTGFSFVPLDQVLTNLLTVHARGFAPPIDLLWLAPLIFLFGSGLLVGVMGIGDRQPNGGNLAAWRRFALLVSWLVLPVVFIYLLSLRQPVFTERYVIWIGPAVMLILGLGLQATASASGRAASAVVILFLIFVLALFSYFGWQQKVLTIKYDLRSAVASVFRQRDPRDLLILQIPHQEWSYRYFSSDFGPDPFARSDGRLGRWAGGPYTNYGQPDAEARAAVDVQMRNITRGAKDIWVMLSEAEMWDTRRLMDQWLAQHAVLVSSEAFPGVEVRHYQLHQDG